MRNWRICCVGWLVLLFGAGLAHVTQTANGIKIEDIRLPGDNGKTLSALLYVPATATPANPAPGILAVHGYINSRETQSAFAIEFARRGYVVLALDQTGHGYSDGPAFSDGFGGPAGLRHLLSLDVVDTNNIGLEGHSMGGWAVLAAASAMPNAYQSVVLQGSSTGPPFAADGSPNWPRNLALVFSAYDEFSELMWGVSKAGQTPTSPKLQALFNTQEKVIAGQLYGNITQGNARVLYQPPVTHPGDHISHTAVGHALDWFALTLQGGSELASNDQIWLRKELGTLLALIGWVVMLLGTFNGLLHLHYFAPLRLAKVGNMPEQQPLNPVPSRPVTAWTLSLLSLALPAATFYPLFALAENLLPPSAWLPQGITNQVICWAVVTALLGAILSHFHGRSTPTRKLSLSRLLSLVFLTLAIGYFAVWVVGYFLLVDFRFWVVGLKALSGSQATLVLIYLWPMLLYFLLILRGLHLGQQTVGTKRGWLAYVQSGFLLSGGLLLLLLVQYGSLFSTGALLTPSQPLNTIIMIQFVPLLLIVAVISTFLYRRTGSYIPGAIANALIVTWYMVAGQATQYGI